MWYPLVKHMFTVWPLSRYMCRFYINMSFLILKKNPTINNHVVLTNCMKTIPSFVSQHVVYELLHNVHTNYAYISAISALCSDPNTLGTSRTRHLRTVTSYQKRSSALFLDRLFYLSDRLPF